MKLSFQTVCLVFLVTAIHLIVITVFAPVTKSATDFFANLDVETILENGREDFVASQDIATDPVVESSSSIEVVSEETEKGQENIETEVASMLLQKKPDLESASNSPEPLVAIAKPVRGAVTDVRVLSERVDLPTIRTSADLREESQPVPSATREESKAVASPKPESNSNTRRLQVREIRPL